MTYFLLYEMLFSLYLLIITFAVIIQYNYY